MIFIVGCSTMTGEGKKVNFNCPKCGPAQGVRHRPWLWGTFFYIPILPLGPVPEGHVICHQCGSTWHDIVLDPARLAQYLKDREEICKHHTPGSYCSGCGRTW